MVKRILLLGATGRTGRLALEYALAQGLAVTALVRRPEAIGVQSDRLTLIKGSPLNADDVQGSHCRLRCGGQRAEQQPHFG